MKNALESFFWGIIAALGALVVEIIVFSGIAAYKNIEFSFAYFFTVPVFIVLAACIEEFFKYLIISKKIENLSLEKSYIVNSLLVGLGFFGVEMAFFWMSSAIPALNILSEIAILHMGTAGLIGYLVAIKNPRKFSTFLYIFPIAALFHTSYNLLVMKREPLHNYLIFALLGMLVLANIINFIRISRKISPDSN